MVKGGGGCIGATSTVLPNLHSLPSLLLSHRRPRAIHHPLLLERRLGRGETGDRHAERRAGHVVHAHAVTEFHRRGLATMLPADADLELGPRSPAEAHRQFDELADALLIEHLERVEIGRASCRERV